MTDTPHSPDLVEPEGVNAGSAVSAGSSATPPHGDALRPDGSPTGSPTDPEDGDVGGLVADEPAGSEDEAAEGIARSLADDPGVAAQAEAADESGQDNGSIG